MDLSSLPATINWNVTKLSTFRKSFGFPLHTTQASWNGWGATIRLQNEEPMTLQNGALSVDNEGWLIWSIPSEVLERLGKQTIYNLILVAPDGTSKHYVTGKITFF